MEGEINKEKSHTTITLTLIKMATRTQRTTINRMFIIITIRITIIMIRTIDIKRMKIEKMLLDKSRDRLKVHLPK